MNAPANGSPRARTGMIVCRLFGGLSLGVLLASPAVAIPALSEGGAGAPAIPRAQSAPVYSEFRGVRLGMTAEEVRSRLGKPQSSDKAQDFFVFSDHERARVYYDADGGATAIVASYFGKQSNAPSALAIVGEEVEPDSNGAISRTVKHPERGYTIIYSRTGGDTPMVFVTLQKL